MKIIAFIENPAGTKEKQEFERGEWIKKGTLAVPYPFPYGFIKNTLQEDGDPLDVFILTKKSYARGDSFEIVVLGLVEFYEDGQRDYKILAKSKVEQIAINEEIKKRITYFLLHAFDGTGKTVKLGKYYGANKAIEEIKRSLSRK